VAEFWNTPVDLKSPALVTDNAPLSVSEHTPLAKVHYLFLMLGLSQLYITHKGALKGIITRDSFIKLK
jgi:CBS domain-containing protein